jgi:hypothetical protein
LVLFKLPRSQTSSDPALLEVNDLALLKISDSAPRAGFGLVVVSLGRLVLDEAEQEGTGLVLRMDSPPSGSRWQLLPCITMFKVGALASDGHSFLLTVRKQLDRKKPSNRALPADFYIPTAVC